MGRETRPVIHRLMRGVADIRIFPVSVRDSHYNLLGGVMYSKTSTRCVVRLMNRNMSSCFQEKEGGSNLV